VQYSTLQYTTLQYSTVQYSTVQYTKRAEDYTCKQQGAAPPMAWAWALLLALAVLASAHHTLAAGFPQRTAAAQALLAQGVPEGVAEGGLGGSD